MRGYRGLCELGDLSGLANIKPMDGDLSLVRPCDLGGNRLQAGLIPIGDGEIATAPGKFQRQRTADAAGRACHGSGGSTNCGHLGSMLARIAR